MRKIAKMPSVQNVAAGAQANISLPCGLTYDFLLLKLTNITLAQLTNIQVKVNGKTIQEFLSGTELDAINTYHGRGAFADGVLRLWFIRPEMELPSEKRITALGTADVQTFSLSANIDALCVDPEMEVWAQQSAATPLGLITKVKAFPRTFSTAGKQEIDTLPRGSARIATIHLAKDDISKVDMLVDGRIAVEAEKTTLESIQKSFGKVPQTAAYTHIDYIVNGNIQDALALKRVQDMRVQPTLDTAGAVRTIVEYLDDFSGI